MSKAIKGSRGVSSRIFDYLSIDIGSTPATMLTPGADKYAIAAKPVPKFLAAW
ncbi:MULTISPECIES: hypothetical protein [unclassified Moorena]|nr:MULTISPECIES: hypothetical protein [unclassified Moorena]